MFRIIHSVLELRDLKDKIEWDCIFFSSKTGDGLDKLCSTKSSVSWIPAVSTKFSTRFPICTLSSSISLVVPAIFVTYITECFLEGNISFNDQIYLTSLRHREAVEEAVESLYQLLNTIEDGMPEDFYIVDLMDAYKYLGLINGHLLFC